MILYKGIISYVNQQNEEIRFRTLSFYNGIKLLGEILQWYHRFRMLTFSGVKNVNEITNLEDITEKKLDEADNMANTTERRYTHEDVFDNIKRKFHVGQQ